MSQQGVEKALTSPFFKKKNSHIFSDKICQHVTAISFGVDTDVQEKKTNYLARINVTHSVVYWVLPRKENRDLAIESRLRVVDVSPFETNVPIQTHPWAFLLSASFGFLFSKSCVMIHSYPQNTCYSFSRALSLESFQSGSVYLQYL